MSSGIRHQCLVYKGAPSCQLPALAVAAGQKLRENYRCIYLNSPHMVAGMRSQMAAAGVDVAAEVAKGSLVVSSDRHHLIDGSFDVDLMLA
jgi:MEDS: MEthanogen/methylotroph, DcmR Sensory domain